MIAAAIVVNLSGRKQQLIILRQLNGHCEVHQVDNLMSCFCKLKFESRLTIRPLITDELDDTCELVEFN